MARGGHHSPDASSVESNDHHKGWLSQPRRKKTLVAAAVALVVIALALGLGLGLGLGRGGGGDGDGEPPRTRPTAVWQPAVGESWQIILNKVLAVDAGTDQVEPDVDVFDIDMFMHRDTNVVANLHRLGKKVICYFSAGSYEPYRPDSDRFADDDMGDVLDGWPDERWLNLSSPNVRAIMRDRIRIAHDMGCDAIDPDNVDGFQNDNGLGLTPAGSADFVRFLAAESTRLRMSVGLKNAGDIIDDVLAVVHFAVNEQCAQYNDCDTFTAFVDADKPVFHIEYPDGAPDIPGDDARAACSAEGAADFSTVLKLMELNDWVEFCDGETARTQVV